MQLENPSVGLYLDAELRRLALFCVRLSTQTACLVLYQPLCVPAGWVYVPRCTVYVLHCGILVNALRGSLVQSVIHLSGA